MTRRAGSIRTRLRPSDQLGAADAAREGDALDRWSGRRAHRNRSSDSARTRTLSASAAGVCGPSPRESPHQHHRRALVGFALQQSGGGGELVGDGLDLGDLERPADRGRGGWRRSSKRRQAGGADARCRRCRWRQARPTLSLMTTAGGAPVAPPQGLGAAAPQVASGSRGSSSTRSPAPFAGSTGWSVSTPALARMKPSRWTTMMTPSPVAQDLRAIPTTMTSTSRASLPHRDGESRGPAPRASPQPRST